MIRRWPWTVIAAGILTAIVAAAAFAISFASLVYVGRAAGVTGQLAVAYPLTIDGLLAVGVLAAVVLRAARLRSRLFVWSLIFAAVGVSVIGNMAHARAAGGGWLAAAAGAVPPLALAVTLELLVMIVRHRPQPSGRRTVRRKAERPTLDREPVEVHMTNFDDAPGDFDDPPLHVVRPTLTPPARVEGNGRAGPKSDQIRAWLVDRPDATAGQVASVFGVSDRYARRLVGAQNGPDR